MTRSARARQRFSLPQIRVRYASDAIEATGQLANVSRAGLFIMGGELPQPGALATIQFRFADSSIVDVRGQVRWTTQRQTSLAGPGFGVALREPGREFFEFVHWLELQGAPCDEVAEADYKGEPTLQPGPGRPRTR